MMHLHIKTVRKLINQGRMKAIKIGKEYRITEEQLKKFIEENQV